MSIDILEHCSVSPSPGAATEQLLPLLHSDIFFIDVPLTEFLIFYSIKCSESQFLDTIVPKLKNSLSLTLKHFLPLAGKIVFPLTSGMPVSHYVAGDSVPLTIAQSDADFMHLTGNHSRDSHEFYDFVARMPSPTHSSDVIKVPVTAIQVTLFPNKGICIGYTVNHAVGDAPSIFRWLQVWASIAKFNGDSHLGEKSLPSYDRSTIRDAKLATVYWDHMKKHRPTVSLTISSLTYMVRRTFNLREAQIEKLKRFGPNRKPAMGYISSFVAVCGLVWSCLTKSEEATDDASEYLCCGADYRPRLNPPLPDTYFGNCAALVLAESTHGALKGKDGFATAAQAIKEAINNDKGMNWLEERRNVAGKRLLTVGGSPKFDPYGADYGWGRPEKFEYVSTDSARLVYLCKSRRGVEISLSMSKVKMDAFAGVFKQGLREATESICMKSNL